MTTDPPPLSKPRLWLFLAAVLSAISIGILWPLQQVGQVCILIYPAPPGCGAEEPRWVPFVGIGLIVALLAAAVVAYFTVQPSRTILIVLTGAILLVLLVSAGVVALSQTGIWDPYQPYVIME